MHLPKTILDSLKSNKGYETETFEKVYASYIEKPVALTIGSRINLNTKSQI